jgi:hypothetical protein
MFLRDTAGVRKLRRHFIFIMSIASIGFSSSFVEQGKPEMEMKIIFAGIWNSF